MFASARIQPHSRRGVIVIPVPSVRTVYEILLSDKENEILASFKSFIYKRSIGEISPGTEWCKRARAWRFSSASMFPLATPNGPLNVETAARWCRNLKLQLKLNEHRLHLCAGERKTITDQSVEIKVPKQTTTYSSCAWHSLRNLVPRADLVADAGELRFCCTLYIDWPLFFFTVRSGAAVEEHTVSIWKGGSKYL